MVTHGLKVAGGYIVQNSPTILTALGIGGMVTAVVMAVQEPTKVEEELYLLEKEEENKGATSHPIGPRLKIYAKHYWPTATLVITSAVALWCANHINLRRNAALLALTASQAGTIKDIREKIVDFDGKSKLDKIDDSIAADKIRQNPPPSHPGGPDKSMYWIYDTYAQRYMWGNGMMVKDAFLSIKQRLYDQEIYVDLNDLYDEMSSAGLKCDGCVDVPRTGFGYDIGFNDAADFEMPRPSYDGWDSSQEWSTPVAILTYRPKPIVRS